MYRTTMIHDAREIANCLLDLAQERKRELTIMSLLKLIYFSHGWHLAISDTPLISNRIEAWQYGPVVRAVYNCFPQSGDRAINTRASYTNTFTGEVTRAPTDKICPDQIQHLTWILERYSTLSAFELSQLTHAPGTPWYRIWIEERKLVNVGLVIDDHEIKSYFKNEIKNQTSH